MKKRKALKAQYPNSQIIKDALRKVPVGPSEKVARKTMCEHERIDYKTLAILAKKFVGIIEHLATAVTAMEDKFTAAKENVEWVTQNADHAIEKRDEVIKKLQDQLRKEVKH